MEEVWKHGLTAHAMMASTSRARSTVSASTVGTTGPATRVSGQKIKIKGMGMYTWLDGRKYYGEWLENNMDGYGIYTWADGRCYQGMYKDDKKHGYGVYVWVDGREYNGWWYKGK